MRQKGPTYCAICGAEIIGGSLCCNCSPRGSELRTYKYMVNVDGEALNVTVTRQRSKEGFGIAVVEIDPEMSAELYPEESSPARTAEGFYSRIGRIFNR